MFIFLSPFLLSFADSFRSPEHQVSVKVFVAGVHVYQKISHEHAGGYIRCRYTPTCSRYAVAAVETHGIGKGVWLAVRRLSSCRSDVPMGTYDPVPPRQSVRTDQTAD